MLKQPSSPKWLKFLLALVATVIALVPGRAPAQTLILFENFENIEAFTNRWTIESLYTEDDPLVWGVVHASFGNTVKIKQGTGTNMLYCVGSNNIINNVSQKWYPDNVGTTMYTEVDLTDYRNATLSFWFNYRIFLGNEENFFDEVMSDYMTVYVDDERVWGTDDFDVYAEPTDPTYPPSAWTLKTIDLSPFAGTVRTIRFDFESDFSSQDDDSGRGEGIYVDEILVNGYKADRPDFDQNGYPDLVWKNQNGRLSTWLMEDGGAGYDFSSSSFLSNKTQPKGWNVVGQNDFNDDGHSDILWQHNDGRLVVWHMTNTTFHSQALLKKRAALNWQVRGLADVNNDGERDFIFQNLKDGRVSMWLMNGREFAGAVTSNAKVGAGKLIVAVNDFNYDGNEDLLLQKTVDGTFSLVYLSGANVKATRTGEGFNAGAMRSSPWRVKGSADVNGDGSLDLIVYNKNNSRVGVFYLNAFKYAGLSLLRDSRPATTGWAIVGPK